MSTYQISHATELMQNYRQADVLGPQRKFLALQTKTGTALLFSISTKPDEVFYVTKEVRGDTNHQHGWKRQDLRGNQIKSKFPSGVCKDFAAAQCVHASTATIQLALVVNDQTNDHLYLSLGNSDSDTSWTDAPTWIPCPFNATDSELKPLPAPQPFTIANVFISEATDRNHIVVDVLRDPEHPGALISRYFIDVSTPTSPVWQAHDVGIQLEAKDYKTCLGRREPTGREIHAPSDGLYTSGVVSGHSQFSYKPLKSPFGEPALAILKLTADASPPSPDAIAACRKPDNTSDLYAAHGGCLYYFASNRQFHGDVAVKVLENALFTGVKDLFASVTNGIITVWGRNGSNQIFYTTCAVPEGDTPPSSWSVPLPIMTEVQNVTPYVNKADSAQTFFAHTAANEFKIAVKSPQNNGTWSVRDVHLPRSRSEQQAQSFRSYTTRVHVTGEDKQRAGGVDVVMTATKRTSVSINHLYYVVGPVPITVKTDLGGTITIVEEVTRVDGTQLTLSVGDSVATIDPMHDSSTVMSQMQTLRTPDGLLKAKIRNQKDKTTKDLVKRNDTKLEDHVTPTATNIDSLLKAHEHLTKQQHSLTLVSEEPSERYKKFVNGKTPVKVDAGDLLMHLESMVVRPMVAQGPAALVGAGESWWDVLVEWFEGAWNFILKIGEAIFAFVIEVVEQVFEAFAYVLQKIVEWFKDEALDFFKWFFDVDNIILTKRVMKNVMLRFLEEQVEGIHVLKGAMDERFGWLESELASWAGLDWSGRLGDFGKTAPNSLTKSEESSPNAPMWMLGDHFAANAGDAAPVAPDKLPAPPSDSTAGLRGDVENMMTALDQVKQAFQELAKDAPTIPLADTVKRFVGIVGHLGLETVRTVLDALLDILYDFAKAALAVLDATVKIPVVSDILNEWGVPPFSILDVLCYVGAAPAVWISDVVHGRPPFSEGPETTFLIEATDFQSIRNKFSGDSNFRAVAAALSGNALAFFVATRGFSAIPATISIAIGPLEAYQPDNLSVNPLLNTVLTFPNLCLTLFASTWQLIGTTVLVASAPSPSHKETKEWGIASLSFSAAHLLTVVGFCQPLWTWRNWGDGLVNRRRGAGLDAGFGLCSIICACGHWHWLDQETASTGRTLAILGETSNFFSGWTRIARFATIMIPSKGAPPYDPKFIAAGIMGVMQAVYAGLQWGELGTADHA